MLRPFVEAREAYQLGQRLQRWVQRARGLHPWVDRRHSLNALQAELDELRLAVASGNAERIAAEADDVCAVALRIREGA